MSEKQSQAYYDDLITRYLSGNATDAEVQELESWVLADPVNKDRFTELKKAWMLSGMREKMPVNTEAALQDLWAKTEQKTKVVKLDRSRSSRRWLGIAAGILVLVAAVSLLWLQPWQSDSMTVATTDQIELFDLTDGSAVTLNQTSGIAYSYDKKEGVRKVELQGDAFFDVERDEEKPFIIKAREVEIEVLGTSFYVDARSDQPEVQVIVESGRVAVRAGGTEAILEANEKAIFDTETRQLEKVVNQDGNYLALKTGQLQFENSTLEEVVFALNRQYRSVISIGTEALRDCPLTATYNNKSLEAVLTILESSLPGVQIEQSGRTFVINGTCE